MKYIEIKDISDFDKLTTRSKFKFVCKNCGAEEKFDQFHRERLPRYSNFLCRKCSTALNRDNCSAVEKMIQTNLAVRGVEFASQDKSVVDKCKKTKLELYGNESFTNREKALQTMIDRYGSDNPMKIEEFKNKSKNTRLEIYGDSSYTNREKAKETMLNRYGSEYTLLSDELKQKVESTNIERYDSKNPFGNKDIQEKRNKTMMSRYGVKYSGLSEEITSKVKTTMEKRYGVESYPETKQFGEYMRFLHQSNPELFSRRIFQYDGETFDSGWEVAIWIYAKDHNEEIEREPVRFSFTFNGKEFGCYPDFLYKGKLIEVKGDHFFNDDGTMKCPWGRMELGEEKYKNLCDLYEAKHICELSNGVEFWKKKECEKFVNYVDETYGKQFIQSLSVK